jgi:hypothetical protein
MAKWVRAVVAGVVGSVLCASGATGTQVPADLLDFAPVGSSVGLNAAGGAYYEYVYQNTYPWELANSLDRADYFADTVRVARIETYWKPVFEDQDNPKTLAGLQVFYAKGASGTLIAGPLHGEYDANNCSIAVDPDERISELSIYSGEFVDSIQALAGPGVPLRHAAQPCGYKTATSGHHTFSVSAGTEEFFVGFNTAYAANRTTSGTSTLLQYVQPLKAYSPQSVLGEALGSALAPKCTLSPSGCIPLSSWSTVDESPSYIASLFGVAHMTSDVRPQKISMWFVADVISGGALTLRAVEISYINAKGQVKTTKRIGVATGTDPCEIQLDPYARITNMTIRSGDGIDYVSVGVTGPSTSPAVTACGSPAGGQPTTSYALRPAAGEYFVGFSAFYSRMYSDVRPVMGYLAGSTTEQVTVAAAGDAFGTGDGVASKGSFSTGDAAAIAKLVGQPAMTYGMSVSKIVTGWTFINIFGEFALTGIRVYYTSPYTSAEVAGPLIGQMSVSESESTCVLDFASNTHRRSLTVKFGKYINSLAIGTGNDEVCGELSTGVHQESTIVFNGSDYLVGFQGKYGSQYGPHFNRVIYDVQPLFASLTQDRSTTIAPTASPTHINPNPPKPTARPTTSKPSRPTKAPTTRKPTTAAPTRKPTTSKPSKAPTPLPTRKPTTAAPTRKPTTSAPSKAPTPLPTRKPTTAAPTRK